MNFTAMIKNQSKIFLSAGQQGTILIYLAVTMFIFSLVMLGLLGYATMELRVTRSTVTSEQAFQIAEAGVNYYQWHLAYFPNDFWDGNASTTPGPYVHTYVDSATGQTIGKFALTITPPAVGSTIVTIKSDGYISTAPLTDRLVTVRYGVPSLAQYAFLANSDIWIGDTENVSGQFLATAVLSLTARAMRRLCRLKILTPATTGRARLVRLLRTAFGGRRPWLPKIFGNTPCPTRTFRP